MHLAFDDTRPTGTAAALLAGHVQDHTGPPGGCQHRVAGTAFELQLRLSGVAQGDAHGEWWLRPLPTAW